MPFLDVVGHGALVQLISRAVCRETLPPSLLFAGPDGVGKRRVAMALAQVQNCLTPTETATCAVDACGVCDACSKIARGSFTDVLEVEPGDAGSIAVDQVRQVVRQAAYRPFEGRRRVVVIRDADRLVSAAQNALLKTLEEPAASSQFILVTARPGMLLSTVRSRLQRLTFGQLTTNEIEAILVREGVDGRTARVSAATAGGSAGRALASASGDLVEARDAAVAFLREVATAHDARQRLEAAKELVGRSRSAGALRQALTRRLQALTSLVRDVELLSVGSDAAALANADIADRLEPLSPAYGRTRGVDGFAAVGRALEAVERNVSPKVVADWLACHL